MQSECCCLSCAFSDLTSTDHWKWPEYGVTCDVCHVVSVLRSSDLNSQPVLGGSRTENIALRHIIPPLCSFFSFFTVLFISYFMY